MVTVAMVGAGSRGEGAYGGWILALMDAFVHAVATGDRSAVLSGPQESLHTHLAVFAAERARRTRTVVRLDA